MELPMVGLGTWTLRGDECTDVVRMALELGYRHVDTAHLYENHQAVAEGIKGFDRSKLYITSKIAVDEQVDPTDPEASVHAACEQALRELQTDYLDLYLIHAPNRKFPLEAIFGAMEELAAKGKICHAGVSNYTLHHLEDLQHAGYHPFANQVEFHPYLNQEELLGYCRRNQITLISFRSFGKGLLLSDEPLFGKIGTKYNKTGAQVVLRWLVQKEIPVIPKATSEKHLRENINIFDFSLSQEEMGQLDALNQSKRYCRAEDPEYAY